MRRPGGGYQPEGSGLTEPPKNPPNHGSGVMPPPRFDPTEYFGEAPPADHVRASRCPVCGRGDCPEDSTAGVPATWIALVIALVSIPLALGWVAWWLGWGGGAAVIARGLEGLW